MAQTAEKVESRKDVTSAPSKAELQKAGATRVLSPFEEMDRLFEGLLHRGWLRPFRWEWPSWAESAPPLEGRVPHVDVIDRDNEMVVRAELPGVDKKDVDVSVTENTVTIRGSTRHETKEERGDYYRCEISRGSFARTVALPGETKADAAKATFKDGVLELTLPKVEKSKRRSIRIE